MPHVCRPKASSMASISAHAVSANCALSASDESGSERMRLQLFHMSIARM